MWRFPSDFYLVAQSPRENEESSKPVFCPGISDPFNAQGKELHKEGLWILPPSPVRAKLSALSCLQIWCSWCFPLSPSDDDQIRLEKMKFCSQP